MASTGEKQVTKALELLDYMLGRYKLHFCHLDVTVEVFLCDFSSSFGSLSGLKGGKGVCGYDRDSPMGDDFDESVQLYSRV